MPTILKSESLRRALSAVILLALVFSMFGNVGPALKGLNLGMVSLAFACKDGKPCEDAPGQVAKTEEPPAEVPLVNNGGQTLPDNAVANGVANQPQNQPAQEPAIASAPTTENLVVSSNVGLPGGTNNLPGVGNVNNNGLHNGGNPHVYTTTELQAFAQTLGFDCGENATNSNVACWNYWYITNLHRENGQPVCASTGNANNPLIKDYGGWLIKLSMIKSRVDDGSYTYGETYTCGGNSKNNKR